MLDLSHRHKSLTEEIKVVELVVDMAVAGYG